MDPRDVLQANLRLIEGIVERVCRRSRIHGAEAEDFASTVKLKLVENDYAVLREYEGRAGLATYLTIVISRWLADETIRDRGRWHPSAEAVRLGPPAVLLESLVFRERRPLDAALPLVRDLDPSLTRKDAEALLARLPRRRPHVVVVELDADSAPALLDPRSAEQDMLGKEARGRAEHATRVIRDAMRDLGVEERMIVRLRFGQSMSVADISRMLRLPQRPLYRRLESLLDGLRRSLAAAGIDTQEAIDLIEAAASMELDFGLRETEPETESAPVRQTKEMSS